MKQGKSPGNHMYEIEMKKVSKTHVHETMHVNNKTEMNKACSIGVHRKRRIVTLPP